MKSFRNVLVHRCGKIDDELAFSVLRKNLNDFDTFKKEILKFINN